jgi:hypothetical protein
LCPRTLGFLLFAGGAGVGGRQPKPHCPPATFFNCANVLHLIFVLLLLLGLQGWLQLTPHLLPVLVLLLLGHGCLALGKHFTFPTMHPSSDSLTPASLLWLGACCPGHWRGGLQPACHAWRGWHLRDGGQWLAGEIEELHVPMPPHAYPTAICHIFLILSQETHGGRLQNYGVVLVVVAVAGPRHVVQLQLHPISPPVLTPVQKRGSGAGRLLLIISIPVKGEGPGG